MPEEKPIVRNPEQTIRELSSRLAFVEERYKNFDGRLMQLQKNVVEHHQETRKMLRDLEKQTTALRDLLETVTDRMKTLRNEILIRASKEDLAVIKKYIDVWNPFQFVTVEQVDQIVEETLQKSR